MGGVEASVARFYGLPVASYRDAVWPDMSAPPPDLLELWRCLDHGIHPDWVPHQLVADVVKHALGRLLMAPGFPHAGAAEFCAAPGPATRPPPLQHSTVALAETTCAATERAFSVGSHAAAEFEAAVLGRGGQWFFGTDVPGRPAGWNGVLAAADGSDSEAPWISLPLRFDFFGGGRPVPRVEVTFLRSYEGFVDADVSINASGCEAAEITPTVRGGRQLVGTWRRRQSTPFTLTLGSLDRDASGTSIGWEQLALSAGCVLQPGQTYALTVTLRGGREGGGGPAAGKFKLLGVASCVSLSLE